MNNQKIEGDWIIVSSALHDTQQWILDNPFIANEDTTLVHFKRAMKKYAKQVGREPIDTETESKP
jgi:hypothetical protein